MMFNPLVTSVLLSTSFLSSKIPFVDAFRVSSGYQRLPDDTISSPRLLRRDVYNPKITNPTVRTTWVVGSEVTVTWDVSGIPEDHRNMKSRVVLGWIEPGKLDEHLDLEHPLAQDFTLAQGQVTFAVPRVQPRDNYIVVVFGDSGNHSPPFSIRNS